MYVVVQYWQLMLDFEDDKRFIDIAFIKQFSMHFRMPIWERYFNVHGQDVIGAAILPQTSKNTFDKTING